MLTGKRILLGICGSIAAYKAAFLTRLLIKAGAEVQVLMTPAAADFISPLTLSTLSKRPVYTDVHSESAWNNHVDLGLWADAMLVAPLTATTLGKMANGLCDIIIVATYLSARCPVFVAPAMDVDMWHHPATQQNLDQLRSYGNHLIPVGTGELASGLVGDGRLAEPEEIVAVLEKHFAQRQDFQGKRLLITAGPTYEPLDPVRFIGNHSTGSMGVALAEAAAKRGAQVELILGPSSLQPAAERIELTRVRTAREMHQAAVDRWPHCHAAILAAAVSDYRPATVADRKIKKGEGPMQIELVRNPDIALELGHRKRPDQVLAGFALETDNERANARGKLERKRFDFIVLNSLRDQGAGFGGTTNKITVLSHNKEEDFELKSKPAVAEDILDELSRHLHQRQELRNEM